MANGELIIDNKLLKAIDALEKKLQKVSTSSKKASVDIRKMFAKTTPQGIDNLIKKLQNLEKYYQNIGANESKGMKRIAKQARDAADEINKVIQSLRATQSTNYGSAMRFSSMAKSLAQDREAINRLKQARENLSRTDSEYHKKLNNINSAILTHRQRITSATRSTEELSRAHRGLFNTSDQLTRKLALVFSVSQVQGYMSKLVSVRKEFELQQKALSAIIGDQDKANELWNQTVALAVKSPFRVKELVTYTKQLAAYRIETDQLHDTTKRLADVSAGLGVDMSRLILAYGQVRAANFLRGTELRQFTEAGIPMLDELAKHFTELEGRAVSAGDVFERISKRMVLFEDVAKVFENMTNEGGVFFKMQEKQSETLYGMISNLHDSLDLMMNDIGKANDGLLKGLVSTAKSLVDNWRAVSAVLKEVVAAMALMKLAQFYKGIRMVAAGHVFLAAQMNGAVGAAGKMTLAFRKLGTVIKAHPILMIVGALASVGYAMWEYWDAINETNKKYDEMSEKEIRRMQKLEDLQSAVENNNAVLKDATSTEEARNKAIDDNKKKLEQLKKEYPQLTNEIKVQENGVIQLTDAIKNQNAMLRMNIILQQQAKGGFWQEDAITNYNEALEERAEAEKKLYDVRAIAITKLAELEDAYFNKEVKVEDYIRIRDILTQISNAKDFTQYNKAFDRYNAKTDLGFLYEIMRQNLYLEFDEYEDAVEDVFDNVDNMMSTFRVRLSEIKQETKGSESPEEQVSQQFGTFVDEALKMIGYADEELRKRARDYVSEKLSVKLEIAEPDEGDNKPLENWVKNVTAAVTVLNEKIKKELPDLKDTYLLPVPTKTDTKESYLNIAKARLEDINKVYREGQQIIDEADVKAFDSLKPFADEFERILNISKKTSSGGGGKGKDWFSEMAKSIRDTHKEFVTLHKDLDKTNALEEAIRKNEYAFLEAARQTGLDLSLKDFVNLDSEGGAIGALLAFLEYIPESAKNARLNVNKFIGELTGEDITNEAKRVFSNLQSSFENMFGEYELTLNLKEAGFNSDWIESFFNVPNTTLDDIRAKIRSVLGAAAQEIEDDASLKDAIQKSSLPEDVRQELIKNLEKVTDSERKALQKRLEQYLEYSKKSLTAVSQIRLKEAQELQSVNDTLTAEIERIGAGTEKGKKLVEVLDTLRKSIKDTADRDVISAEWDEFKGSEMFLQFFEDAEFATTNSINNMLEQLEYFRQGLAQEDDVELMRTVVKEMEKLEKIKLERAPFAAIVDAFQKIKKYKEDMSKTSVEGLSIFGIDDLKGFKSEDEIGSVLSKIDKAIKGQEKKYEESVGKGDYVSADSINANIEKLKEYKENLEKLKATGGNVSSFMRDAWSSFGAKLTEIGSSLPQMQSHLENMGVTFSDGLSDAIETTSEAFTGLGSALQGFASGNYLQGVMGVLQTLGALFQVSDKKKERQIQREIELVEKLVKQYEKLEKQINETYNIETFDAANKAAEANLEQQIAATQKMIALEEDKKKTDEDKIKEYKERIDELNDKLEELEDNRIQSLGGFGSKEAYKSASQEFVDAWIEAYKETGDGLTGLEEQFDEFFLNMVKKQVLMRGVDKFLDPFYEAFDSMFSEDSDMGSKVSEGEIAKMKEQWENTMPELSDFIESLVESMGVATDLRKSSDELSGLQRGIQGVTEETAQVIEGYLNSIRFFVAEKHRILSDFITNFNNPEVDNPLLSQLKIIATQTSNIHELLNSLTTPHPTLAGRGLKVVI